MNGPNGPGNELNQKMNEKNRQLTFSWPSPQRPFSPFRQFCPFAPPRRPQKKKGLRSFDLKPLISLAGPMGLEPTASGVTGRRYNRLNYDPAFCLRGGRYRDRTYDPRLVRPTLSQLS